MQKDLNLFSIYKASSSNSGGGGFKSLIVIAISFIILVLIAYGILLFLNFGIQVQIQQINKNLNTPSVVDNQKKLITDSTKNQLMKKYQSALDTAKLSFDASRLIDSELFKQITDSTPSDVVFTEINITPQIINITGTCTNPLSPAVMTQALNAKNLFKSITFDGITFVKDTSNYTFKMDCEFKEATSK